MLSIAFLIPIKTEKIEESFILNLLNLLKQNFVNNYVYNFYLGFNYNDIILKNISILEKLNSSNFNIHIIEFNENIKSGHLTKMWNELFKISFENNDYFYQLGDDIIFKDYNFIDKYIEILNKSNNIGVTGYVCTTMENMLKQNNTSENILNESILSQSFVSKKHMDIFGYFFPEKIINWYCDDWISKVYLSQNLYYPIFNNFITNNSHHLAINTTGSRYSIVNDKDIYENELINGINILEKYCSLYGNGKT